MFCVRVAMRVKPQERERVLAYLKNEEREVPERFSGCERFAVFSDPADPDSLLLYEEWASKEVADAYLESDELRESGTALFPLIDGPPDSAYFEAVRVGP